MVCVLVPCGMCAGWPGAGFFDDCQIDIQTCCIILISYTTVPVFYVHFHIFPEPSLLWSSSPLLWSPSHHLSSSGHHLPPLVTISLLWSPSHHLSSSGHHLPPLVTISLLWSPSPLLWSPSPLLVTTSNYSPSPHPL